jgi:hypothetical protein
MLAVVELSDGSYKKAEIIGPYIGDVIDFVVDGTKYRYVAHYQTDEDLYIKGVIGAKNFLPRPFNHAFLKYRPDLYINAYFVTDDIRRLMTATNEDGEKELMELLKTKGVKEMSINQLATKYTAAVDAVNKADENLREAKKNLKDLEREIEEMNKKPMVYFKNGYHGVIMKYEVSNDGDVVEFEMASGQRYMYYIRTVYDKKTFPNKIPKFERYDGHYNEWVPIDTIDHIELLEGVDEYDKTREL